MLGLIVGATAGGVLWALVAASAPPPPPVEGDVSRFVADVTVPDGSAVAPAARFVKTWEIRNVGTVPWKGRYLERQPGQDGAACRTPERVPVPTTAPGESVRVSVDVDAPPGPAKCKAYFKMVDDQGRAYFPKSRGLYFDVVVQT